MFTISLGEYKANMATLPLIPDERSPLGPKLVGIAKLAAEGEQIREGHNVEYFTLAARSILTRCNAGDRLPFTWTINPYRGCEFACKYCYARYTHEFMEMRDGYSFEQKIFVKQHTAGLLRRELKRVKPHEDIAIGTATDPYQPAERRYGVTRAILEEFSRHRGFSIGLVSKSQLITRDIDVLQEVSKHNSIAIHVTVTTTDVELARKLEPRAPRPDLRLQGLKQLREAGINAGVICAPVLPGITDSRANLDAVVKAAKEAGAAYIYCNPLFLKPCSMKVFMPFLEKEFPHLVPAYQKRYEKEAYVSKAYRRQLVALLENLCHKHGMPERHERQKIRDYITAETERKAEQMRLF
jgi:DNA repair photolyase